MEAAGIICEYNPLHLGHCRHMEETRALLGGETPIVCAMSGNFVQRGDFAVLNKLSRAEAAVKSGADLVLELPLPYALSSAEGFALGGIKVLSATGMVTHLSFGSESGNLEELERAARCLLSEEFPPVLKEELSKGAAFGAARQRAAERLMGKGAEVLRSPNNILAVEYLKALYRVGASIRPMTICREGADHDAGEPENGLFSASGLRELLLRGDEEAAARYMPEAMRDILRRETEAGRAPARVSNCERAILARLRTLTAEDFLSIPDVGEGLERRLFRAALRETSFARTADAVKTKRYAHSRIRRILLCAYLGITKDDFPEVPPYLRVLAFNERGRGLLREMKKRSKVPIVTRPARIKTLPEEGRTLFQLERRATDLYVLAYPDLQNSWGGQEWSAGAVRI
ncbi:tRNA(Met) cytidine acetate ligase [Papillibacter cinnamivorans]|uniref:tRNA(Met) cytidine acetate ligase n=1 Tax=Papillibacter cinnamivorans DSM 12816 TaxID=1122930 RepID=A0A1W2BVX6_9FIRM|nr:nucleotidyltransferase family protein [Papillibacter cinnamivorans]SMC76904.1 Predicted nucleotidyltransferase [Papillibacter cinnamivorans DSM 12816]